MMFPLLFVFVIVLGLAERFAFSERVEETKSTRDDIFDQNVQLGANRQTQKAELLSAVWRSPDWKDVKTISSCPQCGRHVVYLTFDDGPADTFPEFAAKLHDVGAKATFFWCAGWMQAKLAEKKDLSPELQKKTFRHFQIEELRSGLQDGHHAVASHTWSHAHLSKPSTSLDHEINDADVLFNSLDLSKGEKITIFRPPYGEYNSEVLNYMKEHNKPYTVVLWDIDTLDWDANTIHTTEDLNSRIDAQWGGADGGDAGHIILMHEGKNKADNVDSIQKVVAHIRELCPDCEFESLDQCPHFIDKGASSGECPQSLSQKKDQKKETKGKGSQDGKAQRQK